MSLLRVYRCREGDSGVDVFVLGAVFRRLDVIGTLVPRELSILNQ